MPSSMTQAEARQHKLAAQRGSLRSLEAILEHLLGGDVPFDNLTVEEIIVSTTAFIRGRLMLTQATPPTATATATLTAAQMLGGILVATPAAVASYTTLTGTLLEAALSANLVLDDTFDLTIINLGGADDIITLVGGTGVTIVGSVTVDDPAADVNSSGTFRFRRSAANVFIAYRVS